MTMVSTCKRYFAKRNRQAFSPSFGEPFSSDNPHQGENFTLANKAAPIVVTGGKGQLGSVLTKVLGSKAVAVDLPEFDLTQPGIVREQLLRWQPQAVINTAAYTQVDQAETEPDRCFEINAKAVETLAQVCSETGCPLMQISTDYVFGADGKRHTPYAVDDAPGPLGVYGRSKLSGEQAARLHDQHYIVRTCGLYSVSSKGPRRARHFVDQMLTLAQEQNPLRVVDDQVCAPTYVPHLCSVLLEILKSGQYGIHHAVSKGETSWFEFATELFRQAQVSVSIVPISSAEFVTAAPRPLYSVLLSNGWSLPTWQEGLQDYLQLANQKPR